MLARVTAVLAASVIVLALGGCSRTHVQPPVAVALLLDSAGPGDRGFNDAAIAGLARCARTSPLTTRVVQPPPGRDEGQQLALLAIENADTVVALGYGMGRDVDAVARRFAKTRFAIVDGTADEPNVESISFAVEQSAYLAGALAGMVSRTGRVAFLGGADIEHIRASAVGFAAGARAVRPGIVVVTAYAGSFDDRGAGARAAERLYGDRVDIVYAVAGRSGLGAIDAAKAHHAYVIGTDADEDGLAPGVVLTSALKRVDVAVEHVCREAGSGKPYSGRQVLGVADGAVGLTDFHYTRSIVGAARLARLERLRAAIADGRVVPPSTRAELAHFHAPAPP